MHENRETSRTSRINQERDRSAKVISHNADTHALEESDRAVVPMNRPNKILCSGYASSPVESSALPSPEGRGPGRITQMASGITARIPASFPQS
jgi:hypothetical protein